MDFAGMEHSIEQKTTAAKRPVRRWPMRTAIFGWLLMALFAWAVFLVPGYYAVRLGGDMVVAIWERLDDDGAGNLPDIMPAGGPDSSQEAE